MQVCCCLQGTNVHDLAISFTDGQVQALFLALRFQWIKVVRLWAFNEVSPRIMWL